MVKRKKAPQKKKAATKKVSVAPASNGGVNINIPPSGANNAPVVVSAPRVKKQKGPSSKHYSNACSLTNINNNPSRDVARPCFSKLMNRINRCYKSKKGCLQSTIDRLASDSKRLIDNAAKMPVFTPYQYDTFLEYYP